MSRRSQLLGISVLILGLACAEKRPDAVAVNWKALSWPVFRGDTQLSGRAETALPESPKLRWSFETGSPIISSPVIGGGYVYIGSTNGKIYCLTLEDGVEKWIFDGGDDIEASPLLVENILYIGTLSGLFLALDAQNGQELWRYDIGSDIMGSANFAVAGGKTQVYVGSYDGSLYSFDAKSGALLWSYQTDNYINGSPATDGNRIIFGGCDEMLHIVSAVDGSKIAQVDAGSYIPGSPAMADGMAYVGHYGNRLLAIDLTGTDIVWEYESDSGGGPFFASPAVGPDRIVAGSRDQLLHCVDRNTGELLWTFRTRDEIDSSPVIAGSRIIAGSADGRLYMVTLKEGKLLWSFEIGGSITSSPAVAGGQIIIGGGDGSIYAFGEGL